MSKAAELRIRTLLREAAACFSDIEHRTINGFDKRSLARKGLQAINDAEKLLPTLIQQNAKAPLLPILANRRGYTRSSREPKKR